MGYKDEWKLHLPQMGSVPTTPVKTKVSLVLFYFTYYSQSICLFGQRFKNANDANKYGITIFLNQRWKICLAYGIR